MSQALKCPNPSCTFLFDPALVPPGAVLMCPRCNLRFTLGPTAPPVAPERAPTASPTYATDPPALPTQPEYPPNNGYQPPIAVPPIDVPATSETRQPQPPAKRSRTRPKTGEAFPILPLIGVLIVVGTLIGIGLMVVNRAGSDNGETGELRSYPEINIAFEAIGDHWEYDEESKRAIDANLFGLRHTNSDSRAGFAASDFKTRNPQPGELRERISDRLAKLFDDLDVREQDSATWLGQAAVKFIFRGNLKPSVKLPGASSTTLAGEAYAVSYQGIGYWFYGWGPEKEAAKLEGELQDLRSRAKLLDTRKTWKPTTQATKLFNGDAADYRLSDGDGWWKKLEPQTEDPKADLLLEAEFKLKQKRDIKPSARLAVLILEPKGEPIATLQDHLRQQFATFYDLQKWSELDDAPQGDPSTTGEAEGVPTVRYRVDRGDNTIAKLVVLSAMNVTVNGEARVVGAYAYCPWDERTYWERRLIQLAGSLRPGGSK